MNIVDIKSIKPGDEISGVFALCSKKLLPYRDGSGFFLVLTLGNKTGYLEARAWENAEELNSDFKTGDVVLAAGLISEYKSNIQLNISLLQKCSEGHIKPEYFIPSTGVSVEEVHRTWLELTNTFVDPYLKQLLLLMAGDQDLMEAFARSPAAKRNHHALLGGLWKHCITVVKAAEKIAAIYPQVDRDLLLAGALLHDIGKIEEYKARTEIEITGEGLLLGHIVLGTGIVDKYISRVEGFPPNLRMKLLHIIVSHHGRYEWQSPKRPKFVEAAILHHLDMIDAQVDMFNAASAARYGSEECNKTWVRELDRYVFCD